MEPSDNSPLEPRRLNERPIYLRSVYVIFGISQWLLHIWQDYDLVRLPTARDVMVEPEGWLSSCSAKLKLLDSMLIWPESRVGAITQNVVTRTVLVSCISPLVYGLFIRRSAWHWWLGFAQLLHDIPSASLSYIPPHYPSLVYRSLVGGLFLHILWQFSIVTFSNYVGRQPWSSHRPLCSQSQDPLWTLLNGLRSKKETPSVSAWYSEGRSADPEDLCLLGVVFDDHTA